jgi:hypothetical protein
VTEIYKMDLKKHFSLLMAFLLLFSSLGATGYERYCACSGEVLKTIYFKSKSDCCKHPKKTVKSCCSNKKVKSTNKEKSCGINKGKCCDTKLKYSHLDQDFPCNESNIETIASPVFSLKTSTAYIFTNSPTEPISPSDLLLLTYQFADLPPPFFLSGKDILRNIQINRC